MSINAKKFLDKNLGLLSLAKLLMAIRQSEELTQDHFASKLGISKSHLCDLEKGRKFASPERAHSFAKKLKYLPEQFVRLSIQDRLDSLGLKYKFSLKVA